MLPPPARPLPSNRRLVLYLVLLAAVLPEATTGSTPPLGWTNPFLVGLLLWFYGAGVLVCRELAVRWRAGWPGIGFVLLVVWLYTRSGPQPATVPSAAVPPARLPPSPAIDAELHP